MTFEPPHNHQVPNSSLPQHPQPTPQQAVWARAPQQVQWQETPELEYHQLYRGVPRYRWWKPLVALILAALYYITFSLAFTLPVTLIYALVNGSEMTLDDFASLALPDTQNPWSIFVSLGSIALMIPAVWLAMLSTGLTPKGRAWSVALRIRWQWIWRTIVPTLVSLLVMNTIGIAIEIAMNPLDLSESEVETVAIDVNLALISMLLVVLLVPLQATAEELVFRGMFMQTLGAWFGGVKSQGAFGRFMRGPWLAILIPAIAFGLSHIYNVWGLLAVAAMGITMAWITWRTGGLEAAIVLHVLNNIVVFGFLSMAPGGETGQSEDAGGPGALIGQVIGLALYCWWVDRSFSRRDGRRTRIDQVQVS